MSRNGYYITRQLLDNSYNLGIDLSRQTDATIPILNFSLNSLIVAE